MTNLTKLKSLKLRGGSSLAQREKKKFRVLGNPNGVLCCFGDFQKINGFKALQKTKRSANEANLLRMT